ncbi:amino acid adenylation domain-containing protein, partial [Streptomyces xanthochromogenes]|uniref:amino acid adenylation domain-containing protein n=1 Tax=Streptomyces xanthochromogenes TaxID=67384 RepID=UPI0037F2D268
MSTGTENPLSSQDRFASMSPAKRALLAKRLAGRRASADDAVVPVPRTGGIPLSSAQQRLWFIDQLNPGSAVFNLPVALRLSGPLKVELLEQAVRDVLQRHESLRTVFAPSGDGAVQHVLADVPVDLTPVGLGDDDGATQDQLAAALAAEAARPFSLADGPLVRATLLRTGPDEHVLALVIHHSVCDGWSMGMVVDELLALYAAGAAGTEPVLKPLSIQFADYSVWEAAPARAASLSDGLDHWRRALRGAPQLIDLPTDRRRPAVQTFRGGLARFSLPRGTWTATQEMARQERATPFMVLLGAFAALLSRYSTQGEVTVATPVANRPRTELEDIVGFFTNSIALRVDTSGSPAFRDLVGRVRTVAQEGLAHSAVPFERVVEAVDPARSLSHAPLAQVSFALVDDPALDTEVGGLRVTTVDQHTGAAKYDLTMELWPDRDGGLHGSLEYTTDLFDQDAAARIADHFGTFLHDVLHAPETAIGTARLVPEQESHRALTEWNSNDTPLAGQLFAHELVELRARETPDATALVAATGDLTFAELDRRAALLAARLRHRGVGAESRVGLFLERGTDLVVAILATLKAGAAYVPLDVTDPADRTAYMLSDAAPRVVVTDRAHAAELPPCAADVVLADDTDPATTPLSPGVVPRPHPDSACYVIYTSGSTGLPKGVVISHRGLANYLAWSIEAYRVADGAGAPLVSPVRFDLSVTTLFCPLAAGRPVVLVPEGDELDTLAEDLGREELRHGLIKLTPAHLEALDSAMPPARVHGDGCLVVGGESLRGSTVAAWRERVPGLRVINEYGPTETVVGCCVYEVDDRTDLSGTVPIGRPIANTRLYVLDENLAPVAPGTVGELHVGGAGVARGYWNRPDLTAERFLPDPFAPAPGARMYRTGDLVRLRADGELVYLGRVDTQVKVRGYRIELAEVEGALARAEDVRDAAVVLCKGASGERRLAAYMTLARPECTEADLRAALRRELPDYMVPHTFTVLEELPLASSGKIDRTALAELSVATGERATPGPATGTVPVTALEWTIAGIWADVLGLPREAIGRDADFLSLGGHSLLATRAVAQLRDALNADIPLRAFLRASCLADLAERIDELDGGAARPALVHTEPGTPVPLSFAQGRLYFLSRLAEGSSFYNVPIALRLDGDLNRDALRTAFGALWERHEGLRTRFPSRDGEPVQEVLPAAEVPFTELDLSGEPDAGARFESYADEEARKPFDLARGPLLRVTLVRLREREHGLLMTLHHTVSDGWSVAIFLDELAALYRAFTEGQPSPLAPLAHTYMDYTLWQRSWLRGEELDTQVSYWKRQLADVPVLDLPSDRPRPAVQSFRGARHEVSWSPELTRSVKALAARQGVSLFMLLLAGLDVVLARASGQRDITVGTPVANRTATELEPLVGFFANTLALRVDLSGDPTFTEVLRRVRTVAQDGYAHQDVPFDMVVDAVAPTRSLSHTPLFQVRFALQNQAALPDAGPDLTLTELDGAQHTARFDLVVDLWEADGGLEGHAEYSTDLFDAETVARLMGRFEELLGRLVEAPHERVFAMDGLSREDRAELDAFTGGPGLPRGAEEVSFVRRFVEQAARTPDAPAVTCGDTTLSYGELRRRSGALASVLAQYGTGPGTFVAVHLERRAEFLVAVLAVLEAGGAYVPLDPAYPAQRLAAVVADARPALLLTSRALAPTAPSAGTRLVLEDAEEAARGHAVPECAPEIAPDSPAYVVHTSGTKGLPKGVVLSHRGLAAYTQALPPAVRLPERPVVLHTASFAFSSSVRQFALALAHGGHVVVAERSLLSSPEALLDHAAAHGVHVLDLVPSYLRVAAPALARRTDWRPALVLTASEPLSYDLAEKVRTGPGAPLQVNMYGQTETTGIVAAAPVAGVREGRGTVVPLGHQVPGTRLYVLDEFLRQVPPGYPGEVCVAGPGLALAYLGDPCLTAERFVPDPFGPAGGRLYRTGDRGRYLRDGKVEFLGRIGDQVKIRGHRVEPADVASALSSLDGVGECVVLCDEDVPDERRLTAYVVPRTGSTPSAEELRTSLREKLPDYMVPVLSLLDALPRLPNGKVDRAALRAPATAPRATGDTGSGSRFEEPLAGIWREVLRVGDVGPLDDFFALGGDSLHVIRV